MNRRLILSILQQVIPAPPGPDGKIFPGAVGYGTSSRGAYGGTVDPEILIVDSLSGASTGTGNRGTLRWALEQTFPRIIVFEVEGVIDNDGVNWRIQVLNPFVNVYGQTAPGKGVTIKGCTLWLQSTDMLFQHIRIKPGNHSNTTGANEIDAVNFYGDAGNVVFDQCSFGWSQDELVGTKTSTMNVTFSRCKFAEPFDRGWHVDEDTNNCERHPYAALMYAGNVTFYQNLFAFTFGRNPLIRQANNQVINNYIYGGLYAPPMLENIGLDIKADVVGNVTENIPFDGSLAPAGDWGVYNVNTHLASSRLYVLDNHCKMLVDTPALTQWELVRNNAGITQSLTPLTDLSEFDILPSAEVKEFVLNNAGALPWNRDISDQAVIDKIRGGYTGQLRHSVADYPATARNIETTATSGDMSAGFDWATTAQTLVLSYNAVLDGEILGPTTINLTANCVDQDAVVTHINSVLPAGLICSKIGKPGTESNQVQIATTHANSNSFIEVHSEGTGHATLGIAAGEFYGAVYVGYDSDTSTESLSLPASPHTDPEEDGFTVIEEWITALDKNISLRSIAVTPATPSVDVGNTQQFTATGTYSDSSTADITSSVTWTSSNTDAMTIVSNTGLATGVAAGSATITATLGAIDGTASVTIEAIVDTALKMTFNTENPGSATNTLILPTRDSDYDAIVNWGDEVSETVTGTPGDITHVYVSPGIYEVSIEGTFPAIYFNNAGDRLKLTSINNRGTVVQSNAQFGAFHGCANNISISDDMILEGLDNGSFMFSGNALSSLPEGMILDSITNGGRMFMNNQLSSLPSGMTLLNLTNGYQMFMGNSLVGLPTDMVLSALLDGNQMFANNNISSLPSEMILENLTVGAYMFSENNLTVLPLGMTLNSLIDAYKMFSLNPLTSLPSGMVLENLIDGREMFSKTQITALPSGMTLASLENGGKMFENVPITDLPAGITLSNLTSGSQMFLGVTLNTVRYSQLLISMEANNINNDVPFHGGNSKYNAAGETAKTALQARGWIFTDGGLEA